MRVSRAVSRMSWARDCRKWHTLRRMLQWRDSLKGTHWGRRDSINVGYFSHTAFYYKIAFYAELLILKNLPSKIYPTRDAYVSPAVRVTSCTCHQLYVSPAVVSPVLVEFSSRCLLLVNIIISNSVIWLNWLNWFTWYLCEHLKCVCYIVSRVRWAFQLL